MAERTRRSRGGTTTRRNSREEQSGGRLNRDYSDEEYREPSEGYQGEQPTKGLYTCELFEVKDHISQGEGNESVRWGFRLVDGSENKHGDDVSGWADYQYTTENTAWKEQQMLVALGVIKPGGKVNLTYDQIVKKAKPCTVKVGVERYIPEDGGDPEWRGRMNGFLSLRENGSGPAKKSSRRAAPEPDEDVFDDEEEGDEVEEEETKPARRSTTRSRRKAAEPEPEEDEEEEPEDEDEEEEEPYDPDELAAELEDLSLAALKERARSEFGVTIKRGMKAGDIIDAVLDTLDEDEEDEEEPEEEPEPPKRSARSRSAKPARATSSRRTKRGSSEDPPF